MDVLKIYENLSKLPLGNVIFSKGVCMTAPYFNSISPLVKEFEDGFVKVALPKRWSISNHIGTVHAIAMCNLAEFCAGLAAESAVPDTQRWIPKGMEVRYLKKAETDLTGVCRFSRNQVQLGDNKVHVDVLDKNDQVVFEADINMYVSEKK